MDRTIRPLASLQGFRAPRLPRHREHAGRRKPLGGGVRKQGAGAWFYSTRTMSGSSTARPSTDANRVTAWDEVLFRRQHGIAEAVWRARGYARYRTDHEGVSDLRQIDANYGAVSYNVLKFRTQRAGLAIPRGALPGTAGPTPLAELRPDEPICMEERWHAHAGGELEHEHDWEYPHVPGRKSDPGAHSHCDWAKYIFVKGEPIERVSLCADMKARGGPFFKLYEEQTELEEALSQRIGGDAQGWWDRAVLEERLGLELPKRPSGNGQRQTGPSTLVTLGAVEVDLGSRSAAFQARSVLRKARASETSRIDANPLALGLLGEAERIYFGIEGCIKADAMLSAIRASGERATVVSVPSVTLWPKDAGYYDGDIRTLARLAVDREVAIVVDSDWDDFDKNKGAVLGQAAQLMDRLRRLGVQHTVIAPPTAETGRCTLHDAKSSAKRGVDDFIADGESLAGLKVVDPGSTASLLDELRANYEGGNFENQARVLHELALRANPRTGVALATSGQLADAIDESIRRRPTGAAPAFDEADQARRSRQARERAIRRTFPLLRTSVGLKTRTPPRFPGGPIPPTMFILPRRLVPQPEVLGTLGQVGVPMVPEPDFEPRRPCAWCGEPLEGAVRSTARYHPTCRQRAQRARASSR